MTAQASQTNIPKLRFPEFTGEWETNPLKTLVSVNPSNTNLPDNFVYIDLESVSKGQLLFEKEITRDGAPSRAQRYLKPKDILFQTVRPYQQNNYFFEKDGEYVASTGYAQLRVKPNTHPEFIYQLVHISSFNNQVRLINSLR